jgi:hypothetical protein
LALALGPHASLLPVAIVGTLAIFLRLSHAMKRRCTGELQGVAALFAGLGTFFTLRLAIGLDRDDFWLLLIPPVIGIVAGTSMGVVCLSATPRIDKK